jgi:hypothetical protein
MTDRIALLLLLLGALTLLGTLGEISVAPQMRRYAVPVCCQRRVRSFEAHARWILAGASVALCSGLVLLFL